MDDVDAMLYLDFGREAGQWTANLYSSNENLQALEVSEASEFYCEEAVSGDSSDRTGGWFMAAAYRQCGE